MTKARKRAMRLWNEIYKGSLFAEDFSGNLMCRSGYGDRDFHVDVNGKRIYCGWNTHHVLPKSRGGADSSDNLVCVNITTNDKAADKTTFTIGGDVYQIKRKKRTSVYEIVKRGS